MRKGEGRKILVVTGKFRKCSDRVDQLPANNAERIPHQDNVRIIAYIAARRTEMNDAFGLRALQPICVYMAHDIVTHFFFPRFRILVVDVVRVCLHLRDLLIGYVKSELFLRLRKGDPESPPCAEFAVL